MKRVNKISKKVKLNLAAIGCSRKGGCIHYKFGGCEHPSGPKFFMSLTCLNFMPKLFDKVLKII